MSLSESRALLPDWHRYRIAWRIEGTSIKDIYLVSYTGKGLPDGGKPHRRSSILPIYVVGGTMKPGFSNW